MNEEPVPMIEEPRVDSYDRDELDTTLVFTGSNSVT